MYSFRSQRGKRIRLPGHPVAVEPHELLVINTPTFQRLFYIKQLGLSYMVYPYATHTRGAHSLDCLYWTQYMIDRLISYGFLHREKDVDQIETTRLSALLHDVMHIPFGHALEDELGILGRHDKGDRIDIMLDRIRNEIVPVEGQPLFSLAAPSKEDYRKVTRLIDRVREVLWTIALHGEEDKRGKKTLADQDYYMADVIGNTMCADLLAYIEKDVDFTGLEKKAGGYTIFDYLQLAEDEQGRRRLAIRLTKGGIRPDVVTAIQSILDVRYTLTEQVIYHHAKCAASAMLGKVATICGLTESHELYSIGDEGLLALLERRVEALPERTSDGRQLKEAARNLLHNLKSRRLYKRVFRVTENTRKDYDRSNIVGFAERYFSSETRTEIENAIEKTFELDPGTVILFCPKPEMALKEARVMVVYEKVGEALNATSGKQTAYELRGRELAEDYRDISERVQSLEKQYLSLWVCYAFIDPDRFGWSAAVKAALEEKMGVHSDPLLEFYLNEKPGYRESKRIVEMEVPYREEARAEIYRSLLVGKAARDAGEGLDDDAIKSVVESTYLQGSKSKTGPSKQRNGEGEPKQKPLPLGEGQGK